MDQKNKTLQTSSDIYQVKPNTPNSMLNKTLSSFLCVQGLIFLSTGAKRGAQRQHWNLGVRGLTTIRQGFDFIVHLRSGGKGEALHTSDLMVHF